MDKPVCHLGVFGARMEKPMCYFGCVWVHIGGLQSKRAGADRHSRRAGVEEANWGAEVDQSMPARAEPKAAFLAERDSVNTTYGI